MHQNNLMNSNKFKLTYNWPMLHQPKQAYSELVNIYLTMQVLLTFFTNNFIFITINRALNSK